jgi:anthraniloyl-CoA monooxygenase
VKIVIIGGGPGGLYTGILLKRADRAHDITVFERNPPDATYGWGVVFSDQTLNSLREADENIHQEITDNFARWDAIEVRYRGEVISVGGHVFAGMSRKLLLNILQRRCAELGVKMVFNREISDLSGFAGCDLIIAADGINSVVRRTHAERFQPTLMPHPRRYVWLGTDYRPNAFTFIVKETEHGLFEATIYPHDDSTSTFVVEVDEGPWRRAGLDRVSEAETIAFCQETFADVLGRHGLMSNKSEWINFATVKSATWHYKNIVLLGDAAHTAHFTVGSGTKLAMEDAIALAEAFERHRDVEAALTYYEQGREPVVERIQEAAQESYTWYEALDRYARFEPIQFVFAFVTRSGRITRDNLRIRDARFVDLVDRWFAQQSTSSKNPVIIAPPPVFTPLRLREVTLVNRAVLAPVPLYSAGEGVPTESHLEQLVTLAMGDAGLILTELTAVSPEARVTPGDTGMYRSAHVAEWKGIVDQIHGSSLAKIALRLGHAGRRGSTRPRREGLDRPLSAGNWPLVSASPLSYDRGSQVPKEMDRADMDKVRDDFVNAARMAAEVGFDMLHLDFAHGYLLASFISTLTNLRGDEFGGSLQNRMRFPIEVFDAVRAEWPREKPISVRLTATDWVPGRSGIEDAVAVAATLKDHQCDAVELAAGQTTVDARPSYSRHFLTSFSDQVRNTVGVRTMTRGNITSVDEVSTIVAAGRADLCVLDPVIPFPLREG